ncbi:MAG: TIM barrel protein [Candidatus Hermodarchaeota archaeon]
MEMIGTAIAFHRYSAQEDLETKIQNCKEKELGAIEFGWNLCTLGPIGKTNKTNSRKQLFFPSKEQVSLVLEKSKNFRRSIHAPYIISLTTDNKNILTSSKRYITRVSTLGDLLQASHFTFHAGGVTREGASQLTRALREILEKFEKKNINILPSIEVAGKTRNFGGFTEVLQVASDVGCLFTWDFAHDYVRGGYITTEEAILARLEKIDNSSLNLKNHYLPIHISGIVGGPFGEKYHTSLNKSDIPWQLFLSVLKEQNFLDKVTIICESKLKNLQDEQIIIDFLKSKEIVKKWFPKKSRLDAFLS